MIVETSVIVAIVLNENDAKALIARVRSAVGPETSIVNAIEATLSVGRALRDYKRASELVTATLETLGVRLIAIETDLYDDVIDAYVRYGKGTGHPARLNFGDCFSYAIAKRRNVPLLYKGDDFARTDLAQQGF